MGRWIFSFILIGLLALAGWYGYRWYTTGEMPPIALPIAGANSGLDESIITAAQIQNYTVPAAQPRYLSIAALKLGKTRVMPVEVNAKTKQETPINIHDVAWYEKSSTPGSGGLVLIDGQNGSVGHGGALQQLKTLPIGSIIVIERGDGQTFSYKVVENQSMPLAEVNSTGMKLMSQPVQPGQEGLNIITTDGSWVPRLGTFDHRIMLRAALVQ